MRSAVQLLLTMTTTAPTVPVALTICSAGSQRTSGKEYTTIGGAADALQNTSDRVINCSIQLQRNSPTIEALDIRRFLFTSGSDVPGYMRSLRRLELHGVNREALRVETDLNPEAMAVDHEESGNSARISWQDFLVTLRTLVSSSLRELVINDFLGILSRQYEVNAPHDYSDRPLVPTMEM